MCAQQKAWNENLCSTSTATLIIVIIWSLFPIAMNTCMSSIQLKHKMKRQQQRRYAIKWLNKIPCICSLPEAHKPLLPFYKQTSNQIVYLTWATQCEFDWEEDFIIGSICFAWMLWNLCAQKEGNALEFLW